MAHRQQGTGPPPYISDAQVDGLVDMKDIIKTVREAFIQFSAGDEGGVVQPVRTVVPVKDHAGYGRAP